MALVLVAGEVPAGAIDGVNQIFTVVTHPNYVEGSLRAFVNGAKSPAESIDQTTAATGVFEFLLDEPLWVGWTLEVSYLWDDGTTPGAGSCSVDLELIRRTIALDVEPQEIKLSLARHTIALNVTQYTLELSAAPRCGGLGISQTRTDLEVLCPV